MTTPLPDLPDVAAFEAEARRLVESGASAYADDAHDLVAAEYGFASWEALTRQVDILQAIAHRNLDKAGDLLLAGAARARISIGLPGETTTLTPLQLAALWNPDAARNLLEAGAPLDLHSACALGDAAFIAAAEPASFDDLAEDLPPIGYAILRGRLDAVRALLGAGDDPNRTLPRMGFYVWEVEALARGATRHEGWTPVHAAAVHGYWDDAPAILQTLIERGGDLHEPSCIGETPLHHAACHGWLRSVERLLDLGADINEPTALGDPHAHELADTEDEDHGYGLTALMIAAREGHADMARVLIERGADVNATDSAGMNVLHVAAHPWWGENAALVRLLLDHGSDPTVPDARGRKPREIALQKGYEDTAALL